MSQPRIARLLMTVAAATIIGTPGLATAQEATTTLPLTPNVENCLIETPRTPEAIQTIRDASAAVATPEVSLISLGQPATEQPPSSAPADEATVAAVTATLVTYYGCVNAGDLLGAAALETDEFLGQQLVSGLSLSGQEVGDGASLFDALLENPVEREGVDQITLLGVRDVLVLRTGDVRATVDRTIPGGTNTAADTISFTPTEDGFLIASASLGSPDQPARRR